MQKKISVDECPALKEDEEEESNEIVEAPEPTCDDIEDVEPEYAEDGDVYWERLEMVAKRTVQGNA